MEHEVRLAAQLSDEQLVEEIKKMAGLSKHLNIDDMIDEILGDDDEDVIL